MECPTPLAIVRSPRELERVLTQAQDLQAVTPDGSPASRYSQAVQDTVNWLIGTTDSPPEA